MASGIGICQRRRSICRSSVARLSARRLSVSLDPLPLRMIEDFVADRAIHLLAACSIRDYCQLFTIVEEPRRQTHPIIKLISLFYPRAGCDALRLWSGKSFTCALNAYWMWPFLPLNVDLLIIHANQ